MKDSRIYIIHIRDCITRIKAYTTEGKEEFYTDLKTQDAVIRNLQTMCESVQQLPQDWKEEYPETEWGKIAGFRNVLAHQYLDFDLDVVWNVVENYLEDLETTIELMAQKFWNVGS